MNQEFLSIILIILVGYLFKRINILQEKDGEVIAKIIFKITLPALVIVTLSTVKIEPSLTFLPIIAIIYGLITAFLAYLVFKNEEKELKGTLMMLAPGANVGLFAFPLVQIIWGEEGLTYFGMFDVGTSVAVFGIAYILGSYYSEAGLTASPLVILKKLGKSIPLMTYIIASILNFSNIQLPSFVIDVAAIIAKANIPLSLLLLGLYLNFKIDKQYVRPMLKYLTFRYGLGLLFGLALYYLLPYNQMIRITILIGFLLPVPSSVLPFALEFKYKTTQFVATVSNMTILISIVILYIFANFIL
jgi:malate permease and related proteins